MTFGDPTIRLDPIHAAWNTVASFTTYEEAQEAVDRLSDSGFPVENIDIIGSDLRTVERVTGRLTKRNAAAAGAASGAWFGLFIGLLPPVFLADEIEALDREDAQYAGAVSVVFLIIPLLVFVKLVEKAVFIKH